MTDSYVYGAVTGRRPRRTSKMPRTSATADVEELLFLRIFSGRDATVSRGLQLAIRRLVESDETSARYMRLGKLELALAEGELQEQGVIPTQIALWNYVTANHERLLAQMQGTGVSIDAIA